MDWTHVSLALGMIFVSIASVVGTYIVTRIRNMTAVEERHARNIALFEGRVDTLTAQVFKLTDDKAACFKENANLRVEVSVLTNDVRLLKVGINPADQGGVVVAGFDGIIRVFPPGLVPTLKWLPEELINKKSVEVLIAPELIGQHQEAFKKLISVGILPGYEKIIRGDALDKLGNRVPVVVKLTGWMQGREGMIAAEVRPRMGGGSDSQIFRKSVADKRLSKETDDALEAMDHP